MKQFIELDNQELQDVRAGGLLGGLLGGAVGFMAGVPVGLVSYGIGRATGQATTQDFDRVMRNSMLATAGAGMILGVWAPTP